MNPIRPKGLALALALLFASGTGRAATDDVADQIMQASKAYERHDLTAAAGALDAASRLLRQSMADGWKAMLPPPLPGWTASDGESVAIAAAILGGGLQVSRTYEKGSASVEVSLIVNSPVMQSVGGLLNSGLFGSDESKLVVIDGRKMTYARSDNSYTASVGKAVVTVKGVSTDDATLRAYLGAVRFAEIEKASLK